VRIGVTGHRTLADPARVRRGVHNVLAELDRLLANVPHSYRAISPLAEGADRLVARCVLEWTGQGCPTLLLPPQLKVVLPMPRDEYFATFDAERRAESIAEFEWFHPHADRPTILPKADSREEAYRRVGHYVVGNCDVLIAVWDGQPAHGKGGTAEVVAFAEESNRAVFRIDPKTGAHRRKPNPRDYVSQIVFLDRYNRASTSVAALHEEVEKRLHKWKKMASNAGLDPAVLNPLKERILPHFVKASGLAERYQRCYFWSVTAAYIISVGAVATAAFLSLIYPGHDTWFLAEVIEIGALIALVWPSARQERLRCWIDYRYLAERLRASCFLLIAGLGEENSGPPPDMQLSWLPDNWVAIAIRDAWPKSLPPGEAPGIDPVATAGPEVARFLFDAWITDQREYYAKAGERNREWHERLELWLKIILGLTLISAILHVTLDKLWSYFLPSEIPEALPHWLALAAVTLPALASAIAGISVFRHFNRNAERYESMSRHLREIGGRLFAADQAAAEKHRRPPDLSPLQQLVRDADRTMAHEHQGWRVVVGVHLPGPG